ncbi:pathogen-related protein-like [Cucurbita maxima]|uniref:Pathogen-related protein-like n=1 Tax=Cucurbita maxima TaxID=3661 RepID=A0A6J1JAH5_CUCMA|nr:pathogen-related protein-like [Cucurbita maxima]
MEVFYQIKNFNLTQEENPIKGPITWLLSSSSQLPVWLKEMESIKMSTDEAIMGADKYRVFLHLEAPTVQWKRGRPSYEAVNKLFEDGRTKVWPKGSVEEKVQNMVKTLQMEFANKARLQDFKIINPQKFHVFVNGREGVSGEEAVKLGVFNVLLKNSLPEEYHYFKAQEETFESTCNDFKTCFPRGFAWELLQVYSPPPLIAYKFRHWGFLEGPYKTHSPTGEMVEFYGMGTLKVDSSMRIEEAHFFYDPAELFGGLLKGKKTATESKAVDSSPSSCPFSNLQN